MATRTPANPETQFSRGAWLILSIAVALLLYSIANLAYRFTLPTDGWEVYEGNLPGLTYSKKLMGNPSRLQPGDRVTAVEGVPADWRTMHLSPVIQESWRTGATLDYTVTRDGQEIRVPVTLVRWQLDKWLLGTLRDLDKLAGLLSGYILLALAAYVFLRRPGNPTAGAFLIIVVTLASPTLSETLPGGFTNMIDPAARVLGNIVNWFGLGFLFPFALIRFALVFPRPKPLHQRHPWLSYAAGAIGLILVVVASDSPFGWFWFVFSWFLAVTILIHNGVTMRDAVSRAQLRWGLGGVIIGFGTLALMFLAGTSGLFQFDQDISNLVSAFATTVMGGMLAVAILRYRLWDIDVIIRRTLVYGLLTALLALVYLGSVVTLQTIFGSLSGERSPVIIVLSTLVIAALFSPLRRRVQNLIDRRFFRSKYDAQQVLAHFGQTARDEVSLEVLTAELVQAVQDTMQASQVAVWLKPKSDPR